MLACLLVRLLFCLCVEPPWLPGAPIEVYDTSAVFTWKILVKGKSIYEYMSKHMLDKNDTREWTAFEPVRGALVEEPNLTYTVWYNSALVFRYLVQALNHSLQGRFHQASWPSEQLLLSPSVRCVPSSRCDVFVK